jgi:RNA polymerase sigma-B factor
VGHAASISRSAPPAPPRIDRPAEDRLVAAHHYLCRRGARKFARPGLERIDLEQVAAIGLIKASRGYEAAAGTPFEAYAWALIVGELMHHVRDHERAIRLPRALRRRERQYLRAHESCVARLGREPSDAELARELGVLVPALAEIRRVRNSALLADIDEAERLPAGLEPGLELEDRLLFVDAFARLDRAERSLLIGVYVMGLSRLEVGRRLGLSPRQAARCMRGALARMRSAWCG